MSTPKSTTGFLRIDNAKLYYEMAGSGTPLVMIHAGVADHRQWNNEFSHFAQSNRVTRYDMRGFGRSEPVAGDFSPMSDLTSLLDALSIDEPVILMGCSMGGGLAMDFALTYPSRVKGLIMVASGPGGLKLDVPVPAKFAEVEKAFEAGDLDLTAELETQIWFDGAGRTPDQVDQEMRKLLYDMNRTALSHEATGLGKRLANTETPAAERLHELDIPVLVIIGSHDTPFMLAAADYMAERIKSVRKVVIEDAAHLPNMDQPDEFRRIVEDFLTEVRG